MKTLSLWIFGVLFIISTGANDLSYFPENFVVVKKEKGVTLPCSTKTDEAVTWKFKGDSLKNFLFEYTEDTQNLTLPEVEISMLGEYSCWRGEEMLSSTYLLLDHEESLEEDDLKCWAKSYDCTFTCKWTRTGDTAVRLGLGHNCSQGEKLCQWVTSSDPHVDGGFQFELSHSLSPYAEESTMLKVTAEAIVNLSFLRKTKSFYLRDIVQPDSPQIVKCQEADHHVHVTIDPPSSWSTPHSFFRLEHQIEYVLRDDGKTERSPYALPIPKKISKVRVRSRDELVLSPWSQWTPWKNVRTGKKLCKCKNTTKYCCPELPSGYLDRCKKRRKKKEKKMPN